MVDAKKRAVIGILTAPINEKEDDKQTPNHYFLERNSLFCEQNDEAICVPLRYDLCLDPEKLKRTLDSLDGVFMGGGFMSIRYMKDFQPSTHSFYNTVKETVKYSMEHKLPILGIC